MASEPQLEDELVAVDEAAEGPDFRRYWTALTKRWRLLTLCLATALSVAVLYTLLSPRLYRATVVMDVEPERPGPLDVGNVTTYTNSGPEFLATQMQLMQTRQIAERVARRLNLVENREFNPRRDPRASPEEELDRVTGMVAGCLETSTVRQSGATTRDTNLVQLSAVATSPRLAADIANAVADAYITWNLESKYGASDRAAGYLATQIQQTKSELDQKSQQLLAYGKEKEIVSADLQSSGYNQRQDSGYDAAVADRVTKEARYRDMQNARPETIADTLAGGLVSQLRAEQARLERDYAEKLTVFKPDWPAMRQLKAQIDSGREHLASVIAETVAKAREAARSDYLTALRREESLKATMRSQKVDAMKFNADVVEYNNLKLELDSKKALLDTLLRRQAEVAVMSRLGRERESSTRIAEPAQVPHRPFRPSYRRNILLALLAGGGVGVGLALLLDFLDRSLRTPEQVEQYVNVPALGVIPAIKTGEGKSYGYLSRRKLRRKNAEASEPGAEPIELLPHLSPRSPVAERYRAFRTALLLSRAGGVRSILVSSSVPREGKTATAANLAVVLAQLGKRILLVDADLHRPRLHEIFRASNRTGLVSILAENLNPERVIARTEVPDVFLLPAGPFSPNPSGLLSSELMSNLLEFSYQNFDYVIIDAPPIGAVADALVLGHQTDGVVLCVHGGKTPREEVVRVRDRMLRSNVRVLGVLINNLVEDSRQYAAPDYETYYAEKTGYDDDRRPASVAHSS